jgi:hypothetical protein
LNSISCCKLKQRFFSSFEYLFENWTPWNFKYTRILILTLHQCDIPGVPCIHILRDTWTLWSTLLKQQFAVTTLSTSCNCSQT